MEKPAAKKERAPRIVPRHRIVLKELKASGMKSMKDAILKADYSENVAEKPKLITNTKSWALLLQENLPEEMVAHRHAELLDRRDVELSKEIDYEATALANEQEVGEDGKKKRKKKKTIVYRTVAYDLGPNVPAVSKALEMAYKLRGAFKSEAPVVPSQITYNLFYKPEVRENMRAFEDAIKATIIHESDTTKTHSAQESPVPEEGDAETDPRAA